jgi:hypothetical protein
MKSEEKKLLNWKLTLSKDGCDVHSSSFCICNIVKLIANSPYSSTDLSPSRLSTHKLEFMIPDRKVERTLSIPDAAFMQFSI